MNIAGTVQDGAAAIGLTSKISNFATSLIFVRTFPKKYFISGDGIRR